MVMISVAIIVSPFQNSLLINFYVVLLVMISIMLIVSEILKESFQKNVNRYVVAFDHLI